MNLTEREVTNEAPAAPTRKKTWSPPRMQEWDVREMTRNRWKAGDDGVGSWTSSN